ncbi:Bacterial type II and III secretion system protein [Candidatus Zixiibacteriota bacterium]|nr:Bacterial type II and III secretion system protein [candidate division Zixibacteria bacterium]
MKGGDNMKNSGFLKYGLFLTLLILLVSVGSIAMAQHTPSGTAAKDPSVPIENLTFQAADIRAVIRFLADYGRVNVVVAPNVQGSVTINLRNVMWDQALKIIGQTYDLSIVFETDGYIRVLPSADYRKEQTENEKHKLEKETLARLDVKIVQLANTAADEIVKSIKSLMTERGKVDADERTNSVILQEVPENMDRVIGFIKELDKPARQIKISAQILEISSTDESELGVDWTSGGSYVPNADRSITQTVTQNGDRVTDKFIQYNVVALQRGWDINATISAIVTAGKGKIIAHPEITTIDNKEARIQMGQRVPVKQFDQSGNVVIQFEEVGTILKVTPHITAENQILMHLMPERSTLQPDASGIIINTNNAETNVVVNNGQTAVIGGLTTQDETESKIGLPVLKDLPLIGALFSYKQKSVENRDLVIFVTPTIVEQDLAEGH